MVTLVVAAQSFGGERIAVEGDDYRHLFRALRLRAGDRLRVVDGRGGARFAVVEAIDRRRGLLLLEGPAPSGEPERRVELAVATIRPERAAWAVEKATEVGVVAVHWFGCERAPRRYGEGQLERLRRVAVSAVGQCGRSVVPSVEELPWSALLELASSRAATVLDPTGERAAPAGGGAVLLIVGPEGGLTPDEMAALAERGAARWRLGDTILRTETAAVVAASLALLRCAG
jgi:16S rRNA (uracil1498-N3)-methyltransferase